MVPKKLYLALVVLVGTAQVGPGHAQSSFVAFEIAFGSRATGDNRPRRLIVEDIHQGGHLDIGLSVVGQAVNFFVGDGLGGFLQETDLPVPCAYGAGSADFNRGGVGDLAVTDRDNGEEFAQWVLLQIPASAPGPAIGVAKIRTLSADTNPDGLAYVGDVARGARGVGPTELLAV